MSPEQCDDDIHTASAKKRIYTLVEEGIRGKAPSSCEISLPAQHVL
jgi:hypothetical protein